MTPAPQDPTLAPWRSLQEHLAGYLAARARGFTASEFVLSSRDGEVLGRLRVHGPQGADLEAGDITAAIERGAGSRYRMLDGDGRVILEETAGSGDASEVRCGDRVYEVRLALLRNAAGPSLWTPGEAKPRTRRGAKSQRPRKERHARRPELR
jgi:hypothetical protein